MSSESVDAVPVDNRKIFGATLIELAQKDHRIVAVCNDSVSSSGLSDFKVAFPDRLINVGIAEQNMVGVAAGLASAGLIPFVAAAGPFLSGRATEQIKADVAYSQFPVVLCAMSPGMAYGQLGPTHHSLEDISWMRALPGLDLAVPADALSTEQAIKELVANPRPTYLRIGRTKVPPTSGPGHEWERGKAVVLYRGSDVTFLTYGTTVSLALQARDALAVNGINAGVVDMRFMNPLDAETLLEVAGNTSALVVAEEANVSGALGAAVAMSLTEAGVFRPSVYCGPRDEFAPTGTTEFLLDYFGLSVPKLEMAAQNVLAKLP